MTSFIIDAHLNRPLAWNIDPSCAFCRIVNDEIPNFRLHETDKVIAILDIMPLRRGHALVIPKVHCSRISELPSEYAAAVGEVVSKVANALTKALDNSGLNVVCNQEYAQAVPHVHYHIIPAPILNASPPVPSTTEPLSHRRMHQAEFEKRNELDDEDAEALVKGIRAHL
ncbi:HIT-like protein [Pleurotus eryngii]|uniref:HIT-like protein n=1 Tax=Pleurotus eryngii TaxID=5323 RepID=A0A9P5ZM23_PLEER|nr:HIT-like protein [Pleurotus eryngii]